MVNSTKVFWVRYGIYCDQTGRSHYETGYFSSREIEELLSDNSIFAVMVDKFDYEFRHVWTYDYSAIISYNISVSDWEHYRPDSTFIDAVLERIVECKCYDV